MESSLAVQVEVLKGQTGSVETSGMLAVKMELYFTGFHVLIHSLVFES